jgi:hypothetical protein
VGRGCGGGGTNAGEEEGEEQRCPQRQSPRHGGGGPLGPRSGRFERGGGRGARAGLRSPPGGRCRPAAAATATRATAHGGCGGGMGIGIGVLRCWGLALSGSGATQPFDRDRMAPGRSTARLDLVARRYDVRDRKEMTRHGLHLQQGGLYMMATRRVYDVRARMYVNLCMTCGLTCQCVASCGMRAWGTRGLGIWSPPADPYTAGVENLILHLEAMINLVGSRRICAPC